MINPYRCDLAVGPLKGEPVEAGLLDMRRARGNPAGEG